MEPAGSRDDLFVNVTCEKADHPWSDIRVYEPDARIGSLKCEHDPNITQEVQMTSLGTRMVGGIKADYAEAYPCEGDTTERFLSWVVALPNGKRVTIEATKTGSMDPTRFVESATWVAT
jgi:hypothetical protein